MVCGNSISLPQELSLAASCAGLVLRSPVGVLKRAQLRLLVGVVTDRATASGGVDRRRSDQGRLAEHAVRRATLFRDAELREFAIIGKGVDAVGADQGRPVGGCLAQRTGDAERHGAAAAIEPGELGCGASRTHRQTESQHESDHRQSNE